MFCRLPQSSKLSLSHPIRPLLCHRPPIAKPPTLENTGLEDAQKIADEAINLFRNCSFKLVKWNANKEDKIVLSSVVVLCNL